MTKRRNTPAREAVLRVLGESRKALSQDAIEQQIGLEVDRATVYRVLNRCCEDGILHRVVADDGKQYFAFYRPGGAAGAGGPHFHFRCVRCQTIECLETPVQVPLPPGYAVAQVNCVIIGTCSDCNALAAR